MYGEKGMYLTNSVNKFTPIWLLVLVLIEKEIKFVFDIVASISYLGYYVLLDDILLYAASKSQVPWRFTFFQRPYLGQQKVCKYLFIKNFIFNISA